jgi:hypothetical protein
VLPTLYYAGRAVGPETVADLLLMLPVRNTDMSTKPKSSTERVQQLRERQCKAGSSRITAYLDRDTRAKLDQLAGRLPRSRLLATLMKAAIEREWVALEDGRKRSEVSHEGELNPLMFPGRRRSFGER